VQVLDSSPQAGGASALPWGLMHPHFAADDNLLARLTRAGAALTEDALRRTVRDGATAARPVWQRCGVFQQASDEAEAARWRRTIEGLQLPADYVSWLEPVAAAGRLGIAPACGGLWWPAGLMVSPKRWVQALLLAQGITRQQASVGGIEPAGDEGWRVVGVDGTALASAPVVIVAAAGDAPRLLGASMLPVQAVPGQVTLFDAAELSDLRAGVGGSGTLLRAPEGILAVGATYETAVGTASALLDERAADRSNLERLTRLLPATVDARIVGRFAGTRCVARDRLPYIGAVADYDGVTAQAAALRGAHFEDLPRCSKLYASFALGSRGLSFASLAAELIAAQIEGEPAPIERELAHAVDPARVLLHRLRKGQLGPTTAQPAR
jgi:tRNA 5-methylaminomethyl-2-thiouridine biosynthesis bifunctional protein